MKKLLLALSLTPIFLLGCDLFVPKEPMLLADWAQGQDKKSIKELEAVLQPALKGTAAKELKFDFDETSVAKIHLVPQSLSATQVDTVLTKLRGLYQVEFSGMQLAFTDEAAKKANSGNAETYNTQLNWATIKVVVFQQTEPIGFLPNKVSCAAQITLTDAVPDARAGLIPEVDQAELDRELEGLTSDEKKKIQTTRNNMRKAYNDIVVGLDLTREHTRNFEDKELNLIPQAAFSIDMANNMIIKIGDLDKEASGLRYDFGGVLHEQCKRLLGTKNPFLFQKLETAPVLRAFLNLRKNPKWRPST